MKTLIRLHQLLLILAILSGCYAPDVEDCTVTCMGPDECADGQVCGSDGFCAAEDVAGTCRAPAKVMVHVKIDGDGKVTIANAGTCGENGMRDCMIAVSAGNVSVTATPNRLDHPFDKWTSTTCAGQTATCGFAVVAPTTLEAKFK